MSLRRALMFSFAGRYATMLLEFVSVMVISRVLTPGELGVFSLAVGSIVIGQMLRDFGLSLYIIQEKDLTDEKIQGCFTISLLLCWGIAAIYYFLAPVLGRFYDNDNIELLVSILSINFLVIPFGTFVLSLLKREMKLQSVMVIDVITAIVRSGSSITMILLGVGVVSLAYASVIGALVTVLMTFRHTNWLHYRFNFSNIKDIAKFSSMISLTNIVSELRNIIPEIVIGKHLSVESVAFFSKASSTTGLFSKLILQALSPAMQPYLAALRRNDQGLKGPVLQIFNYIQALSFPFYLFLYVFAEDVVMYLYGPQWGTVPELLRVFCLSMTIVNFFPLSDQILSVLGHAKYVMKLTLWLMLVRLVMIAIFVIYDLELVQLVYLFMAISILRTLIMAPQVRKIFQIEFLDITKVIGLNAAISVILALGFYIQMNFLWLDPAVYVDFAAICGISLLVWVTVILVTDHPIGFELRKLHLKFLNNINKK
ncbi:MAG: O-antigen/teichoic acid export membrane protein [Paraglaciecola sp.]|jgi:O-antigen/teichoic acid export membrane protein